ncbi:hypothetical protein CEXT_414161, partial [Caerostris extrusa]
MAGTIKEPDMSLLLRNGVAWSAPRTSAFIWRIARDVTRKDSHDVFAFANGIARTENRILLASTRIISRTVEDLFPELPPTKQMETVRG